MANISGVYITKTKISKTFSISLSKNSEISPGNFFYKKITAWNMKGYLRFFYSHFFISPNLAKYIYGQSSLLEQHNKIEKKKKHWAKKDILFWGIFFVNFLWQKNREISRNICSSRVNTNNFANFYINSPISWYYKVGKKKKI